MSRKKGAAVAIIAAVAVIGGLATYSAMPRQQEPGPAPVLTTIDRSDPENESTTIAEIEEQPPQDGTTIANNTVIANNTIVINKPVYRNDTIIYQPVTINLEKYRTIINQYAGPDDDDDPVDMDHSITLRADRIRSEGWSTRFTDDGVGVFTAVYDLSGELVGTGYADERGFTVEGLEDTLYFVFPSDCADCADSKNDIMFRQWEDGSRDRPRLVPADSDVTASYRLVVPEKQKQVPLQPPPSEEPPEQSPPPDKTETVAEPEITIETHNATYVYGWVQVSVQLENKVEGFDEVLLSVYAPDGTLHDSFSYFHQQGFFAPREAGDGVYRIAAEYDYGDGTVEVEITHPIKFATPEFVNLSATKDKDGVRLDGMLEGGLAGENITIAVHDPEGDQVSKYGMSFGTKPVFTLFIASEDSAVFNQTGNYTFVVTHDPTGMQGNATLSRDAGNETETAADSVNVSGNSGRSESASLAAQGSDVYLVWQDDTSGQHEIMFAKSDDAGKTFGEPAVIWQSEEGGFSTTPDIAVSGDNVYVVWSDYNSDEQSATAFAMSDDEGETFGNATILGNYTGENTDPQVALFGGDIYVSWVSGSNEEFTGDLMLARSPDGAAFEAALVGEEAVNALMAASGDALYLVWRHHPSGDTTEEGVNMFGASPDGVDFEVSENLEGLAIYAMAASDSEVYVVGTANETVVLARSSYGASFNATDIGSGSSPDVAASGSGVWVVWSGDGVLLASSPDGGETFRESESMSADGGLAGVAADENTHVAWTEDSDIMAAAR